MILVIRDGSRGYPGRQATSRIWIRSRAISGSSEMFMTERFPLGTPQDAPPLRSGGALTRGEGVSVSESR
jgi:hypothetical protein